MIKEIKYILITVFVSIIGALGLHVFVLPANFAPSGIDGISTMLAKITGVSVGWYTALINIPLLIVAWFLLRKRYVIYTLLYTILSSLFLIILKEANFYQLIAPNEKLLIAVISGAILGIRTGIMLKISASTGGIDIIASCIQKYNLHINIENIISLICCGISLVSIFVYHNLISVLLSFLQMFVYNIGAEYILKDTRNAIKFEIITKSPENIKQRIIKEIKHGVTIIECKGGFTNDKSFILTTIINIRQIPQLLNIIKKENDTFVYFTEAKGVRGNFRWKNSDEVK